MKKTMRIMTTKMSGVLLIIGLIVLALVMGLKDMTVVEAVILIAYFAGIFVLEVHLEKKMRDMEQKLTLSDTLVQCITTLADKENTDEALDNLLKIVGDYFGCERSYIFEINQAKKVINNTYEYTRMGITREMGNRQNVPLKRADVWLEELRKNEMLLLNNREKDNNKDFGKYEIFIDQHINALIAAPLIDDGEVIGFLGIENPTRNLKNASLIKSTVYFLMDNLKRRSMQDMLVRLSFEDALTKMYNRNKFNAVIDEYQKKKPESLGIAYFDLNGLKVMNDKYGHKAGDILIRNTAACVNIVFGDCAFRIGGDEFVAIVPDVPEKEFDELIKRVSDTFAKDEISISVGTSWRGADNDITGQMHEADEKMYKNKKKYYKS